VDASDRDQPVLTAELTLSWPVHRVLTAGDYLLEFDNGLQNDWSPAANRPAWLRVTSADDPGQVLFLLGLGDLPLLGVSAQGDRLYAAQGRSSVDRYEWINNTNILHHTNALLTLSVFDLSQLPEVKPLGQTQVEFPSRYFTELSALWPKPGLVVWADTGGSVLFWGGSYYPPYLRGWVGLGGPWLLEDGLFPGRNGLWWPYYYWGGSTLHLTAFDVQDAGQPSWLSDREPAGTNQWWFTSGPFTAGGLVYLGHQTYDYLLTGTNYVYYTNQVVTTITNYVTVTNITRVPHFTLVTNVNTLPRLEYLPVLETVTNIQTVTTPITLVINRQWAGADGSGGACLLAGGKQHSLFGRPTAGAWSWGGNDYGQLGNGTFVGGADPGWIPSSEGFVALAAGGYHTLGLRPDGSVWAWGGDAYGQLGDGQSQPDPTRPPLPEFCRAVPGLVSQLGPVRAVGAGHWHSLAADALGQVWAWGANDFGQLGDGSLRQQSRPVLVVGLRDISVLAGGVWHSLAADVRGQVWAWGRNGSGQLGDDSSADRLVPEPVPGLTDVMALAGGLSHSLALARDGTVLTWGGGDYGQLGDASWGRRSQPGKVAGLGDVKAVASGAWHGLALKADGTVWAWGRNQAGQLGDGTTEDRAEPGVVPGLTGVVALAAGSYHSLALQADGTLWAWGDNQSGQLGVGEVTTHDYTKTVTEILTLTNYLAVTNLVEVTNVITEVTYSWETNYTLQPRYDYVKSTVVITQAVPEYTTLLHHHLDVVDYADPTDPTVRPPVELPGALAGLSHRGAVVYTNGRFTVTNSQEQIEWIDACAYDGLSAALVDSLPLPVGDRPHLVKWGADRLILGLPAPTNAASHALEAWRLSDEGRFARSSRINLPAAPTALGLWPEPDGVGSPGTGDASAHLPLLLAVQSAEDLRLYRLASTEALEWLATGEPDGCLGYNLDAAATWPDRGLWVPLGDYGVWSVLIPPSP
jgi:alpha-tubulin suppressor-like RCC1 family protein